MPGADPAVLPGGLEALAEGWQEAQGLDPKLLDFLREAGVLQEEVAERRTPAQALVVLREPRRAWARRPGQPGMPCATCVGWRAWPRWLEPPGWGWGW